MTIAVKLMVLLFLLFDTTLKLTVKHPAAEDQPTYTLLYPTFLGNKQRTFYGIGVPDTLGLVWKVFVGCGETRVGRDTLLWCGTGWPGQPTLFEERGENYVIIGCLDHNLRKLDAETGKEVWRYTFDDVIKGTATLLFNRDNLEQRVLILQGSRRGFKKSHYSNIVPSFRAIEVNGEELWRLNIKRTYSYSRDVDASAMVLDSLVFLGAENGVLYIIDPAPEKAGKKAGAVQPKVLKQIQLFNNNDIKKHEGNLVIEASPVLCQNRIYIAAGSGHVYGVSLETYTIDWDFYIGSDLDGTITVTQDSCLLVPIEKQYIEDNGGVLKLDPSRDPDEAVVWYFPTGNVEFAGWEGGVIGSVSTQDSLAAFRAIDGYLYVVNHYVVDTTISATINEKSYPAPLVLAAMHCGPSISTPLLIDDKIITAGYDNKLKVFKINRLVDKIEITPVDSFMAHGAFESTPLVWHDRIYIGCRDGYFYCLGKK
ncbi:MAG: PQQ-binding-like beta-propeller repeat protein [candidate division WOR-3 bacterium]|nr:MAG: PQQ-binding-like beta-propeller repeat protein [candidate division WOR-3 bacterium]